MKMFRNIVIFGNARWREDTCGNSSQQLTVAFLQLGFRVLYISPNQSPSVELPDYSGQFRSLSSSTKILNDVREVLLDWKAEAANTVFICSMATTLSILLLIFFSSQRFPIIYRYVDWFDPSIRQHSYDDEAAALACQVARLIAISHPELIHNLPSRTGKVITMTNGVDLDLFKLSLQDLEKPADLIEGDLTVGFWGTFWGNRMDWDLIRSLAAHNPNWQMNFIGDLQYLDVDARSLPSNVHFLGLKRKKELPAYVKQFDLCLIPYRQDLNFAKFSNPIKALESLAALKPVVAPLNVSLRDYPGLFFYSSAEEAEIRIKQAVSEKSNSTAILDFVHRNTWKDKARELLNALNTV